MAPTVSKSVCECVCVCVSVCVEQRQEPTQKKQRNYQEWGLGSDGFNEAAPVRDVAGCLSLKAQSQGVLLQFHINGDKLKSIFAFQQLPGSLITSVFHEKHAKPHLPSFPSL